MQLVKRSVILHFLLCQFSLLNKNLICNPQKQSKIRSRTFNKTIFEGTEHFSVVWFILHNPAEWGRHAINYYRKISISTLDFQATSGAFSLLVSFSLTLSRDNDPDIWKELRQHWPMEQIFFVFYKQRSISSRDRVSQSIFPRSINQLCSGSSLQIHFRL